MQNNLTDTQKFRLGNEIAKRCTGQNRAYGEQHWQKESSDEQDKERISIRDFLVRFDCWHVLDYLEVIMVKKTGDIIGDKAPSPKPDLLVILGYVITILVIGGVLYWMGAL